MSRCNTDSEGMAVFWNLKIDLASGLFLRIDSSTSGESDHLRQSSVALL